MCECCTATFVRSGFEGRGVFFNRSDPFQYQEESKKTEQKNPASLLPKGIIHSLTHYVFN